MGSEVAGESSMAFAVGRGDGLELELVASVRLAGVRELEQLLKVELVITVPCGVKVADVVGVDSRHDVVVL